MIFVLIIFFIIIMLFFWKRNEWVSVQYTIWNNVIYNYRLNILKVNGIESFKSMDQRYSYDDMYEHMYEQYLLTAMFWKWSLKSCIKPECTPLFKEIMLNKMEE